MGKELFTHVAEHQARAVLISLLLPFWFKKRWNKQSIPRVTYTDPEVASIGLSEKEARHRYCSLAVYHVLFPSLDRAITAGRTEGFVKIITKKWSSNILGATIVGERAGEMIMQLSTAIYWKIPLRKLASLIYPYPGYSLSVRQTADLWLKETVVPTILKWFRRKEV